LEPWPSHAVARGKSTMPIFILNRGACGCLALLQSGQEFQPGPNANPRDRCAQADGAGSDGIRQSPGREGAGTWEGCLVSAPSKWARDYSRSGLGGDISVWRAPLTVPPAGRDWKSVPGPKGWTVKCHDSAARERAGREVPAPHRCSSPARSLTPPRRLRCSSPWSSAPRPMGPIPAQFTAQLRDPSVLKSICPRLFA
jgi:hypothetical protein